MNKRILVAGIGNIFHRDDAFGVAVATKMAQEALPGNVLVREFGIRGFDLAMELLDAPALTILVDAVSRGCAPGTLYLLEVEPDRIEDSADLQNAHGLDPARVLGIAKQLGARLPRVLVAGCEPETLEDDSGMIGLSAPVEASIGPAIEMIRSVIEESNQFWAAESAINEVYV